MAISKAKVFPVISLALTMVGFAGIGCGSSDSSQFGPDQSADGKGAAPGGGDFTDNGGGSTPSGDVTPSSACVTSKAVGEGVPAFLVFMFDRSGSMADGSKWTSCATGLKSFFADPNASGLGASLAFFPQHIGGASSASCTAGDYTTPTVPMTALPDGAQFGTAIDGTQLENDTPTLPALQGAIAYAQQVSASKKGAKVAIVLVTDGQPNKCNSTVQAVADAAKAVNGTIPTYVIGVGKSLQNLDAIAAGGGTGKAVIVDTASPAQIATDFQKALGQVKAQALSCEFSLPAAPAGQSLDTGKVNVSFTPAGGTQSTLTYDSGCANGQGWHYDNAAAPSKIILCASSCDAVKADKNAKIDILFGCAVKGTIK
jgi:exosome complex RNA-binding protein Csl4